MARTPKNLLNGTLPSAEAAITVVNGANAVPSAKNWQAKVVVYNTGASARTVTVGYHPTDATIVAGEFLLSAESLASKERREFGIRFYPAGYTFRGSQGTADADIQVEIHGEEVDV